MEQSREPIDKNKDKEREMWEKFFIWFCDEKTKEIRERQKEWEENAELKVINSKGVNSLRVIFQIELVSKYWMIGKWISNNLGRLGWMLFETEFAVIVFFNSFSMENVFLVKDLAYTMET